MVSMTHILGPLLRCPIAYVLEQQQAIDNATDKIIRCAGLWVRGEIDYNNPEWNSVRAILAKHKNG